MRVGRIHASMLNLNSNDVVAKQIAISHKHMFNTCIIVVDEFHPREIFEKVFEALQPSCHIAVFSQHVQPLAEMQEHLIRNKLAIMIRVEELWCREY